MRKATNAKFKASLPKCLGLIGDVYGINSRLERSRGPSTNDAIIKVIINQSVILSLSLI